MPETVTAALNTEQDLMRSSDPFIFLLELNLDDVEAVRIAQWDEDVTFVDNKYHAYPVKIGAQSKNIDGSLGVIEITVGNYAREIVPLIEAGKIVDRNLKLFVVHKTRLTLAADTIAEVEGRITSAIVAKDAAVFSVGILNLFDTPFPSRLFSRGRCTFAYGDPTT